MQSWSTTATMLLILGLICPVSFGQSEESAAELKGFSREAEREVGRMLAAIKELRSYSDDAVIEVKMGDGAFGGNTSAASFSYQRPTRFTLKTDQHELYSDGKDFTVYMKSMRRYLKEPLKKDLSEYLDQYGLGRWSGLHLGNLFLSKDPRSVIAKAFVDVEVAGDDRVEEDRCIMLEGGMEFEGFSPGGGEPSATIYLRKDDGLIRRVVIAFEPNEDDDKEESDRPSGRAMSSYKIIYDVKGIKTNESLKAEDFAFDPPKGAKKVDKLYNAWMQPSDKAMQFELSGKPAPALELETFDGHTVSLEDSEGRVRVINFMAPRWGGSREHNLELLDKVSREFEDRDVAFISILPADKDEELEDQLAEDGIGMTVLYDPGSSAAWDYFEQSWGMGVVLVDAKGIVQGRYAMGFNEKTADALKADLERLLKGQSLDSAKPMTEDQIEEALDQRSAMFSSGTAEPVNEDDLARTWAIRASASGQNRFGFGSGDRVSGSGLWIRDKDVVKGIDTRGKTVAEIPLPDPKHDQFSQDAFTVGRFAGSLGVVYMATIPGEDTQGWGWRPPKGAKMTAADARGEELWQLEFETENNQVPGNLTAADIDGREGDEVLFTHQGSLWIVDDRGEILVRTLVPGWVQWIRADDLDDDRHAEIYVRTQDRLYRFDYRPQ